MMTTSGQIKLIDFGLSEFHDPESEGVIDLVGSPFWMSPEMIACDPHGPPTDIWSFAISLLEMINQKPPNRDSAFRAMFLTATGQLEAPLRKPKRWSDDLRDFVDSLLIVDPKKRPTAEQLLKHPFLERACTQSEMRNVLSTLFLKDCLADAGLGF
jgi:serine/threonine protein kinase